MAEQQIVADFQSLNFIVQDVTLTGRKLGEGSYGTVEEVEVQGTTCVIKKLHEALLPDPSEALGADRMIATFTEECRLMSSLHHPHIVQFLGICLQPGSRLPALLMEKLSTDLHDLLLKNADIPLDMKCSFLVGIAKGLTYLHNKKPPIIHRDLSARNVLLNSAMVAKIADLGNARIIKAHSSRIMTGRKTMTKNPGNMWYMPPEVQGDIARYDSKIDIFSFGVIILFTLTQKFPNTKTAAYTDPMGRVFGRNEIERRWDSFTQIHHNLSAEHPLAQLAEQCLQNLPMNRPSIAAVMDKLAEAQLDIPEQYSNRSKLDMVSMVQHQQSELEVKQAQLATILKQTKADKDLMVKQQQDIEIQQRQIEMRQGQIEALRSTIITQRSQNQILRQELDAKTNKADTQQEQIKVQQVQLQELHEHMQSVQHMNHQLQAAAGIHNDRPNQVSQKLSHLRAMQCNTTSLQWAECKELPMGVADAQAIIANGNIYLSFTEFLAQEKCVGCLEHILEYTPSTDDWAELPTPPVQHFAMATVGNTLVLVGGKMSNKVIVWEDKQRKWVQNTHPPMTKAKYKASAVGYKQWLVVAGGKEDSGEVVSSVEVLDTKKSFWFKAEQLPMRCSNMTPLVVSDTLFLFYRDWSEHHIAVLAAHLPTLIMNATLQSTTTTTHCKTWMSIPKAPLYRYTPFTIGNALLIAGGTKDALYTKRSCEIFCYSAPRKQWTAVGRLPGDQPRSRSTCLGLSANEFLLIGGDPQDMKQSVYKGTVEWMS